MPPPKPRGGRRTEPEPVEPTTFPISDPPDYPNARYDFGLQAIMEMQRTLGGLTSAVDALKERVEREEGTVRKLDRQMYAALALVTVFGGVGVYILDKIWDVAKVAAELLKSTPR